MTRIDVDAVGAAAKNIGNEVEVVLMVSIGSYVAFEDVIAEVTARTVDETTKLEKPVQDAVHCESQRDLVADAAYGIEQMEMIAWTSISTAKSDPAPGLLIIRNLRDVLAHWSVEDHENPQEEPLPVVYRDNVFSRLMEAFESLAIVASESMQHQNFAEVLHTFAVMFDRLAAGSATACRGYYLAPPLSAWRVRSDGGTDSTLSALVGALNKSARISTAVAVQAAQERLQLSVGKLHSRATRSRQNR